MAGATTMFIGAGLSAYQIAQAEKMKKNAKNDLNSYERETLDNAYENVSISTLGSDLLKEETQRRSAGMVDALQGGGIRGVVGGIPKVVASMNAADMQAAKMLDDQYINREYAIAADNARIEGIRENRDIANINALSSQYDAGRQDSVDGIMGLASAAGAYSRIPKAERSTQYALDVQPEGFKTLMPASSPYMQPSATPLEQRKYIGDNYMPNFSQPYI